jgi:hypothetical protein
MTPPGMPATARRAVAACTGAVRDLTPGQRWTTGLMLGLALIVLGFGLPSATRTVFPASASERVASAVGPRDEVVAPVRAPFTDVIVRPSPSPVQSDAVGTAPGLLNDDVVDAPVGPTGVSIVALYDPAVGVGDRTDEAMARRFLATAGVTATFVPIDNTDAACAAVKGAALAVAGGPLPEAVRTCLRLSGIYSLSFDDDAPLGAIADTAQDTALTTRRGAARSLFDTAAVASTQLTGSLGLVADQRLRGSVESLLPAVRVAGLNITTVVWLPAGDPPASAALTLARAGVSGVVFATSTQNQSTIGSQLRTLAPSTKLVVLDAADSITSGTYPPVFDGAIAVTSVQLPWAPGAAEQRAACRSTWEGAQTPPVILGDAELLRALTWCQHAAMASTVTERAATLGIRGALFGLEVTSPITSPLAMLRDGGYGPTTVTQVTWGASCLCWSSTTPFKPSGSAHG